MPELPEAETICRQLAPLVVGKRITSAHLLEERILRHEVRSGKAAKIMAERATGEPGGRFIRGTRGRRICGLMRRGKALIFLLEGGRALVIRLGMSGTLKVEPSETPFDKHTHLRLRLEGKRTEGRRQRAERSTHNAERSTQEELRFRDPRKFGCVALREGMNIENFPEFAHYGPEPLSEDFNPAYLGRVLKGRKVKLGVVLMDQKVIAGIGKIYSDEICFRAGLRPTRRAGSLGKREINKLVAATREVLEQAIGVRGTSAADSTYVDAYGSRGNFRPAVYQRDGKACLRCGGPIRRTRLSDGRAMHWCSACQK